ncbi:monofunctional biosynthetic peptidoglycan transglycosylase [Planobacterium oryzisoli]|uniref:Biosynthetic peptidoglycan transglycosylase n=1 Tax=Planobacterium oryzisoli TaxID=2771435 RepID=A0A931E6L4_9FLAO|nr:monofunctional biosynthetic peptidoglycan transglycosylase [Planobacterium oryzisoli]MBF5026691.1 monofunctional biosynthetic peptidoglycan transglycosylase [Planobacterium oryzisoli]
MWKLLKKLLWIIFWANVLGILLGRFFNPPVTITQIEGFLEYGKLDRDYISSEEMGTHIKKAVIAAEDQKFYSHNGFDYQAIEKALENNEKGKKLRGGSTISQQTAKNVFLWQERSYLRKVLEAFYTFVIEYAWGKNIILERYLNSIEMGQGVFGIEAASHYYYGKKASNLTRAQAAMIAAVLPSPKKYDPKNPSSYLRKRQQWILRQMKYVQLK